VNVTSIDRLKQRKQALIREYVNPSNLKGFEQVLNTLGPLAVIWWIAILGAGISYWITALAMVFITLFTLRVLVLMHECGHGSMFRSPWLNRAFGFVFGVIAGMPQYVWSQHHDFHHANNGNWEKYRGPLTTPSVAEYAAMSARQQRTYEVTRSIPFAPLGGFVYLLFNPRFTWLKGSVEFLVYVVRKKWLQPGVTWSAHAKTFTTRYWNSPTEYRHMFWNNIALLCLWTLLCWAMGAGLFFTICLVCVSCAGGAGIMLFTVQHNFEHAYAADTKQWDYDMGALAGTTFLIFPRWLNWFTANIAYHHIHHLSAKIPNYCLVKCHDENAALFTDVTRVPLLAIPRALKYLLWDAEAQRIISFAEFRQGYARPA